MKKGSASFSVTPEFLKTIDARAEALGMTRTQYLTQLIRRDLDDSAGGHAFRIAEGPSPPAPAAAPVTYRDKKRAGGQK